MPSGSPPRAPTPMVLTRMRQRLWRYVRCCIFTWYLRMCFCWNNCGCLLIPACFVSCESPASTVYSECGCPRLKFDFLSSFLCFCNQVLILLSFLCIYPLHRRSTTQSTPNCPRLTTPWLLPWSSWWSRAFSNCLWAMSLTKRRSPPRQVARLLVARPCEIEVFSREGRRSKD